jgi:SWI/SNF-related matrix-associated actin-dependent regulator of chromatin subfamily A member 2/4
MDMNADKSHAHTGTDEKSRQSMFTKCQQDTLRNQVAAFKFFEGLNKKVGIPAKLKEEWLPKLKPLPLGVAQDGAVENLSSEIFAHRSHVWEKIKQVKKKYDESRLKEYTPQDAQPVIIQNPPLIVTSNMPVTGENAYSSNLKDARRHILVNVMKTEYQNSMQNEFRKRYIEMDQLTKSSQTQPGMSSDVSQAAASGKLRYGDAMTQLLCLQVLQYQRSVRKQVDEAGNFICDLSEKQYRAMLNGNRRQRIGLAKLEISQRADLGSSRARDAKSYRSDIMSASNTLRDLRLARNKVIIRAHERLARTQTKQKFGGDGMSLRLDALKKHDIEAYKEMLNRQTAGIESAGEKYNAICKFLADTEDYMHKLAGRIASVKITAEASKAATKAIEEARGKGLTEEEAQEAARNAVTEATEGNDALKEALENLGGADAQRRYYNLAHSSTEEITEQPRLLHPPKGAKLREYQIVGLQWMISLYNNHLNGILADEMGLGKTVQVMALIAYLMEKKANFGLHLIIVPNAVMVNWKSELTQWLPDARCVYYVGSKDERGRKYVQEVQPLQFNILVTTYEYIMRDRARLSKVDWQYIIIDEAQRMKDRESKLAKDLDKFNSVRRLLLSGTPLQNELQELWSLLNLLLPDVFDDAKIFSEWFGGQDSKGNSDHWLDTEKRVVVVHRLHQILEPFMLRRQVEDVESKLPEKTTYSLHCPMSAHQSTTYSWVKATGTLRLDPYSPYSRRGLKWASLQNKCMELRKVCNHQMLSYTPPDWAVGEKIIRQCGKLVILDRMLVKLKATGHKVLLFSTMTRLLDILEEYLKWRKLPEKLGGGTMKYLRIDGSTQLDDRESAIRNFNDPNSDAFIFLLSIRAAGRGLNLQTSDTVIIYDPDPNPKNEEQAIARSHRIGQTREVKVFHLEAVTDNMETRQMGGASQGEDGEKLAYGDSIESLVRNKIQTRKIAMANEVIDAGRFDQQTSMEERRQTLESMLQDSERSKKASNVSPTDDEINQMLARGDKELSIFRELDQDEDMKWVTRTTVSEIPQWLKYDEADLRDASKDNQKHTVDLESEIAALTGTVFHHHHGGDQKVALGKREPDEQGTIKAPAPKRIALEGAEAVEVSAQDVGPTMTMTTNKSGRFEDDDDVTIGNNEEEEEIMGVNLVIDDNEATTAAPTTESPTT